MFYTTDQIARVAQVSKRYVQIIMKRLGIEKIGRDYLADQIQLLEVMKEIHKVS